MDQFESIQGMHRKIHIRLAAIVVVIFGLTIAIGLEILTYRISDAQKIDINEARKIGNWILPDDDYILQSAVGNAVYRTAELTDLKSNNELVLTETAYLTDGFLEEDGMVAKSFIDKYGISGYSLVKSGEIRNGNDVIYYNQSKWSSSRYPFHGVSEGFLGRMDCLNSNKSITIFAFNVPGKYDGMRAMMFIDTLRCNNEVKNNIDVSIDKDDDGIPDRIEKLLGTDPEKPDTDEDSYDDIKEIKNGYDPLKPSPGDKLSKEDFAALKGKVNDTDSAFYIKTFIAIQSPSVTPLVTSSPTIEPTPSPMPTSPSILKDEVVLENKDWKYSLYIPAGYDEQKSHPLIVGLHGFGAKSDDYIRYWTSDADKNGFIVVVLRAYPKQYPDGSTVESYPWTEISDFARNAISDVEKNYKVDENRIFLTGHSAGASTTYIVALTSGVRFKGVIPIDGYLPLESGIGQAMENANDLNFYIIHGADDYEADTVMDQEKMLTNYGAKLEFRVLPGVGHEYPFKAHPDIVNWINNLP